jgi:hypothetical protein
MTCRSEQLGQVCYTNAAGVRTTLFVTHVYDVNSVLIATAYHDAAGVEVDTTGGTVTVGACPQPVERVVCANGVTLIQTVTPGTPTTTDTLGPNLVTNPGFSSPTGAAAAGQTFALGWTAGVPANPINTYPPDTTQSVWDTTFNPPWAPGNGLAISPFPGDPANGVPAQANWLYSNGNTTGGPYIVGQTTVPGLQPNTNYRYVIYGVNIYSNTGAAAGGTSDFADIAVTLDGAPIGSISMNGDPADGVWKRYEFNFTTGPAPAGNLVLTNSDLGSWGNDTGFTSVGIQEVIPANPTGETFTYTGPNGDPVPAPASFTYGACEIDITSREVCTADGNGWQYIGRDTATGAIVWTRIEDVNGVVMAGPVIPCDCPVTTPALRTVNFYTGSGAVMGYSSGNDKYVDCGPVLWDVTVYKNGTVVHTSPNSGPLASGAAAQAWFNANSGGYATIDQFRDPVAGGNNVMSLPDGPDEYLIVIHETANVAGGCLPEKWHGFLNYDFNLPGDFTAGSDTFSHGFAITPANINSFGWFRG